MRYYYITFRSVTYAQRGEKALASAGISSTLQRTPRWMEEKGCGYCLRLWASAPEEAVGVLRRRGVPMRRVYAQEPGGDLRELSL